LPDRQPPVAKSGLRTGQQQELLQPEPPGLNPGGSASSGQTPKGPHPPTANPGGSGGPRTDLYRELGNLANPHPLARLKALHGIGQTLRRVLDDALDAAELEQVRAARSARASWREIGKALGVSHTQARRRFHDRLT
jgi:hypothetical protein